MRLEWFYSVFQEVNIYPASLALIPALYDFQHTVLLLWYMFMVVTLDVMLV